jgi:hypothetical protein
MNYSILTPYIVPPEMQARKVVNIGDGFILNSIIKLLSPYKCKYLFTPRKPLSESDIAKINSTKALILAGANQLNDDFTIAPEMNLEHLEKIQVPIVPFGIGIYGVQSRNNAMSEATKKILYAIHQRIKFSSWRCNLTIDYLEQFLPELSDKILMTGCPVMYNQKILDKVPFSENKKKVVITVTERGDFWEREVETLNFVSKHFPSSRKILSLHQDFASLGNQAKPKKIFVFFGTKTQQKTTSKPLLLREYAIEQGFKIFLPRSVEDCFRFYNRCDLHIGSRVHAHLYFLSQSKKSFLTYVDDRCLGFAKTLDFPICDFANLERYCDYDFEIYRQNCLATFVNMQKFVNYLKTEVL